MAIVFLLLVTINIIYASYQEIPEPLFIAINDQYYYEEAKNESLIISYFTNKRDTRRLSSIKFEDLSEPQFVNQSNGMNGLFFNNQPTDNPYNDQIGRYYTLKRGYINLNMSQVDTKKILEKGEISFGKGMVTFNDGTTQDIDLGRCVIVSVNHKNNKSLKMGGNGGYNHYNANFRTEMPITIQSIDINGFEPHKDAIDMTLTIDNNTKYTYSDLKKLKDPIDVNKKIELEYLTKDPDSSGNWRFNMITIDMTYIRDGKTYKEFIHYPFGNIMDLDEESIENYVKFWRSHK